MKPVLQNKVSVLIALSVLLTLSCCVSEKNKKTAPKNTPHHTSYVFEIQSPANNDMVHLGDSIELALKSKKSIQPDSVLVTDANIYASDNDLAYSIEPKIQKCGQRSFIVQIYYNDSLKEAHNITVTVLPKAEPKQYSYKLIRKFSHDNEAYVQGLLYHEGVLYESTGQRKRTSLRRINPANGEVLKKVSFEPQYFGEGLALINDELFMLTYTSKLGFVYDIESLEQKRTFDLQTREGWGLTAYEDKLILSDGSAALFIYEPEYFSHVGEIEVCDNKGLVNNINELEITPLGILANIYGYNHIVSIDYQTGAVTGTLDLSDLYPNDAPRNMDYVLNGIAYNSDNNTYFVTGKQWSVMYEIEILEP